MRTDSTGQPGTSLHGWVAECIRMAELGTTATVAKHRADALYELNFFQELMSFLETGLVPAQLDRNVPADFIASVRQQMQSAAEEFDEEARHRGSRGESAARDFCEAEAAVWRRGLQFIADR